MSGTLKCLMHFKRCASPTCCLLVKSLLLQLPFKSADFSILVLYKLDNFFLKRQQLPFML